MDAEIVLRPQELFILGTLMNARYIDYDYVAAMEEIGRNYEGVRRRCLLDLSRAGLVRERLDGSLVIRPQLEDLLKNIFFGTLETTMDCLSTEEKRGTVRLHWGEDSATMVTEAPGGYRLSPLTDAAIQGQVAAALGACRQSAAAILTVRRAQVGVGTRSWVLVNDGGGLYLPGEGGVKTPIRPAQAAGEILKNLKGE